MASIRKTKKMLYNSKKPMCIHVDNAPIGEWEQVVINPTDGLRFTKFCVVVYYTEIPYCAIPFKRIKSIVTL